MQSAEPLLGAYRLLLDFAALDDDLALGRLVGVVADSLHPGARKRGVVRLLRATGLGGRLFSAEFLEGVGAERLNSRRLVRHAFAAAETSAEASRNVRALAAAGALNLHSRGALAALLEGMASWHVDGRARLVAALASEFESFAQAGLFLALLLDAPAARAAPAGDAAALLRGVLAAEDVRDLAGARRDLADALPEHAALVMAALGGDEAESSDADADGNLADFICGDDEVEFSTTDDDEVGAARAPPRGAARRGAGSGGRGSAGGSGGKRPRASSALASGRKRLKRLAPATPQS
jgi:hypothetical protein